MQLAKFPKLLYSILAIATSSDCEDAQDKLVFQFVSDDAHLCFLPLSPNWCFQGREEVALFLSGQVKMCRLPLSKVDRCRSYPQALPYVGSLVLVLMPLPYQD